MKTRKKISLKSPLKTSRKKSIFTPPLSAAEKYPYLSGSELGALINLIHSAEKKGLEKTPREIHIFLKQKKAEVLRLIIDNHLTIGLAL